MDLVSLALPDEEVGNCQWLFELKLLPFSFPRWVWKWVESPVVVER